MNEENPASGIVGLALPEAVDAVAARDEVPDRETIRRTLETVAEDGAVTQPGIDAALGQLSKVVSTPETRAEFAAMELDEARSAAEPVADLDAVRSRLDAFEERLEAVEERVDALGTWLQRLVERADDPDDVFELAVGIRRLTEDANEVHRAADELTLDLESFQRWLDEPSVRYDELAEDVDALESALDDLDGVADEVAAAVERDADDEIVPGVTWVDATMRGRALDLLLADLRAELDDLRRWDRRVDATHDRADEIAARLDALDEQLAAATGRLDDCARPAWRDRHGDRLAALDSALETFEPPVVWGDVQGELETHLAVVAESE
jgi:chromosome segregation ATPase